MLLVKSPGSQEPHQHQPTTFLNHSLASCSLDGPGTSFSPPITTDGLPYDGLRVVTSCWRGEAERLETQVRLLTVSSNHQSPPDTLQMWQWGPAVTIIQWSPGPTEGINVRRTPSEQADVVFIIYQASQKIIFLGLVFYQFGSYPLKLIHCLFIFRTWNLKWILVCNSNEIERKMKKLCLDIILFFTGNI